MQPFNELDPASVDSWTIKIRAHLSDMLSDAGCLDIIDKRNDLNVRAWLLETGRVLRDADDENKAMEDFGVYLIDRQRRRQCMRQCLYNVLRKLRALVLRLR